MQFNTLLGRAIEVWASYDNAHNYALDKIQRIIPLTNSKQSILTIYGMFDSDNQAKLLSSIDYEIAEEVVKTYKG